MDRDGEEAHQGNRSWAQQFEEGGRSVACKWCSGIVVLSVGGSHLCLCYLHLAMAMARLLAACVKWVAAKLTAPQQAEVDTVLRLHKTGSRVGGKQTPDGEEGYRLFHSWEVLGKALGSPPEVNAAAVGCVTYYVTCMPPSSPPCCPSVGR